MSRRIQDRPLWTCEGCGRGFANRGQAHACSQVSLESHFTGKDSIVRAAFDRFRAAVEECGPVRMLPQKTRIAFQVRMSFAQLTPRKAWLDGHLVLARRVEHPLFRRIDSLSPRNHVHHFRLLPHESITPELRTFIREAYAVGEQRHLQS